MDTPVTPGTLFAFGINYKTAPVEVREKLYLNDGEIRSFLDAVKGHLAECLIISTCNRAEVYGVCLSAKIDLRFFKNLLVEIKDAGEYVEDDHFSSLISCAATQQLFNVATSIDSKVIGDSQILRQLRSAYSAASEAGSTGKILNQLFQRAFKLGKTTYTETAIHDGAVSVSLAAVELALRTFGSLRGRTAMVIGAGETARLAAAALAQKKIARILVANRTRSHADELVTDLKKDLTVECEVLDFDEFRSHLPEADFIISSTGSEEPILHLRDFDKLNKKLLIADIAVPRDVDTAVVENPHVMLRNIDDLNTIIDENHGRRQADLPKVKQLIIKEMVEFLTWYYLLAILPTYDRTGNKPTFEQKREILQIKELLNSQLPEIHRLAAEAGGDFNKDLENHHSLIQNLRAVKAQAFARSAV